MQTSVDARGQRQLRWWAVAAFAALAVPPALYHPLASFDEAWYSAVARNIEKTGDWFTLVYNGAIFWDKPPVAIWMTAAARRAFGVGDFVARLPALACGGALVLSLYQWGRLTRGRAFGLLAVLLLLTQHDFVRFAAKGQMDVPVTFFVAAQMLLFWRGLERPSLHLLAGAMLGLAVATKNQVGLFGALAQLGYMAAARDGRPLRQRTWWIGHAVAIAVASPWFVQQYLVHGSAFVETYWHMNVTFRQYAARAGAGADYWFYPRYLFEDQPPTLAAFLAGAGWAVRRHARTGDRWPLLLLAWMCVVPAACIHHGAVHYWYLLPMSPAVALAAAEALADCNLWKRPRWVLATLALIATGQHVAYYVPVPREPDLWAAKHLASALPAGEAIDEPIFLLGANAGSPEGGTRADRQIYIPSAHYYFARDAIAVEDAAELAVHAERRTRILVAADREVAGRVAREGADWRELARHGGFAVYRVRGASGLAMVRK